MTLLWDELEERQRRKFLKELLEKRETVLQRKRRKEKGRFREGGHQRTQVEEERVTGRQRHTKKDSEDGEEVGEEEVMEMGWGTLGLGLSWVLRLTASRRSMSIAALNSPLRAGKRAFLLYFQPSKYFQKVVKTLLIYESILVSEGFGFFFNLKIRCFCIQNQPNHFILCSEIVAAICHSLKSAFISLLGALKVKSQIFIWFVCILIGKIDI